MAVKKAKGIGKGGVIAIASVVLIGVGVGLYFLLRKKEGEGEGEGEGEEEDTKAPVVTGDEGGGSTEPSTSCKYKAPTGLTISAPEWMRSSKSNVKAFQTWVDKNKGFAFLDVENCAYVNFCTGDRSTLKDKVCGSWGQQTQKMWNLYGEEYQKTLTKEKADTCTSWKTWFYKKYLPYLQKKEIKGETDAQKNLRKSQLEKVYDAKKDEAKLKALSKGSYYSAMKKDKCRFPDNIGFDGTRSYYDIQSNMTGEIDELRGTEIF